MKDTSPVELLAGARTLVEGASQVDSDVRRRAAALLIRQALERAVTRFWLEHAPIVASCSTRTGLLCLRGYVAPALASDVASAWMLLSRACHHHPYELAAGVPDLHEMARILGPFVETIQGGDDR